LTKEEDERGVVIDAVRPLLSIWAPPRLREMDAVLPRGRPLAALDASYGAALVPAPFKRYVRDDGQPCNVNPAGSTAVYLWTRSAERDEGGIAAVSVLYDDEPVPDGWRKVARDLSVGAPGGGKSFIAFRVADAGAEQVLASIAVVGERDAMPGALRGKWQLRCSRSAAHDIAFRWDT